MLVPTMAFLDGASIVTMCDRARKSVYFLRKTKMADGRFLVFAARSSAEAYFRSSPPRGHSTVGFPMRCECFVAIWLGARKDIAHNRFQLLFINIDTVYVLSACLVVRMYAKCPMWLYVHAPCAVSFCLLGSWLLCCVSIESTADMAFFPFDLIDTDGPAYFDI